MNDQSAEVQVFLAAAAEVDSGSAKGDCFVGGLTTAGVMNVIGVVILGTAAVACVVNGAAGTPAKRARKVGKSNNSTVEAVLVVVTTGEGLVMKTVLIQMEVVTVVMAVGDILQTVVATGIGLKAASALSAGKCKSELSANVLSKSVEKNAFWNSKKKLRRPWVLQVRLLLMQRQRLTTQQNGGKLLLRPNKKQM